MTDQAKTVFIIGAGPGLSLGLARSWGGEGAGIVLFSRSAAHLDALCAKLAEEGISASGETLDCADLETVPERLLAAVHKNGTPDCVIYNTCCIDPDAPLDVDVCGWPKRFAGDVAGALAAVQTLATPEFAQKAGAVLLTGGTAGMTGLPGYTTLSVDKAALRMLAKLLHETLLPRGIFCGVVQIATVIAWGSEKGDPMRIARAFRKMAAEKKDWEVVYTGDEVC